MEILRINVTELKDSIPMLSVGEMILLSGYVYTARDAAHRRIAELIRSGEPLPFDLSGAVIYYAGPTETPQNMVIGSCGPTTSGRMDKFAPKLYDLGMIASVGKGERNEEVTDAIVRNHGIYLSAIGGAGALAASCIKSLEVIAFSDLGCESVKRLLFDDFPLIVAIDSSANDIFSNGRNNYMIR